MYGHITFGLHDAASVGAYLNSPTKGTKLRLKGIHGIECVTGDSTLFYCLKNRLGNVYKWTDFIFNTDVRANSFIVRSDGRLKTDIEAVEGIEDRLGLLTPIKYVLAATQPQTAAADSEESADGAMLPAFEPDRRTRYGLIAQEVQEIFPELVIEDENGMLGIDYTGLIPLLISTVQDLRSELNEQAKVIENLYSERPRQSMPASSRNTMLDAGASLSQNSPNPFSTCTQINCVVPEEVQQADIFIYDLQGVQKMRLPIEGRGATGVTLEASSLAPGLYIYALLLDGVEIDSRRLIVTD